MSKKKSTESGDEVEELLRAAEDETLLRLSINSHTARGSSAQSMDPDLDRRFQALKSNNKSPPTTSHVNAPRNFADGDGGDDLFARFAALKSSIPSYSSSAAAAASVNHPERVKLENFEDEEDDDEVEKLIKWAVDAARLDPSPPSDTDDSVDDSDEDSDDARTKAKQKR